LIGAAEETPARLLFSASVVSDWSKTTGLKLSKPIHEGDIIEAEEPNFEGGVFNYLDRVDKFDQATNAPVCRHSLELRRVETKAPTDPGYLGHKFEPDSIWIVHDRALAVIVEDEQPIVFVASKLPIDSLPECDDVSSANRRMVSALHKLGCDVAELQGLLRRLVAVS
jgi:hypothetical protein